MRINLEPIGIIKKSGKCSEILIYSDFDHLVRSMMSKLGKSENAEHDVLIVHKSQESDDLHQVQITKTNLIDRVGNILRVGKIDATDDSVIDVRLDIKDSLTKDI